MGAKVDNWALKKHKRSSCHDFYEFSELLNEQQHTSILTKIVLAHSLRKCTYCDTTCLNGGHTDIYYLLHLILDLVVINPNWGKRHCHDYVQHGDKDNAMVTSNTGQRQCHGYVQHGNKDNVMVTSNMGTKTMSWLRSNPGTKTMSWLHPILWQRQCRDYVLYGDKDRVMITSNREVYLEHV